MRPHILKSATAIYCVALFLQYQQYVTWEQREHLEQISTIAAIIAVVSAVGTNAPLAAVAWLHSAPLPKWLYSYRIPLAVFALHSFAFLSLVVALDFQRDSKNVANFIRFGIAPSLLLLAAYIVVVALCKKFYKPSEQSTAIA